MTQELAAYYAKRAAVYEQVYDRPERQADILAVRQRLKETLANHRVLELACGTGYWTQFYADAAASVLATDINPEMLELAKAKSLDSEKVKWQLADAHRFQVTEPVSACFAAFWWSHVKREEQEGFLADLRKKLGKDCLLVLLDNVFVDGSSTTIARTDQHGNTYQIRTLPDGERTEIIKNFPTDSALRKKIAPAANDIRIFRLPHYWMLTCRLK
jgi:SAM-dependent methyltransferase